VHSSQQSFLPLRTRIDLTSNQQILDQGFFIREHELFERGVGHKIVKKGSHQALAAVVMKKHQQCVGSGLLHENRASHAEKLAGIGKMRGVHRQLVKRIEGHVLSAVLFKKESRFR